MSPGHQAAWCCLWQPPKRDSIHAVHRTSTHMCMSLPLGRQQPRCSPIKLLRTAKLATMKGTPQLVVNSRAHKHKTPTLPQPLTTCASKMPQKQSYKCYASEAYCTILEQATAANTDDTQPQSYTLECVAAKTRKNTQIPAEWFVSCWRSADPGQMQHSPCNTGKTRQTASMQAHGTL